MFKMFFLIAIAANVFLLVSTTETCGENEVYVDCPDTVCEPQKCSELGFPVPCLAIPVNGTCPGDPGCICETGYVRNECGICIPSKDCPSCGGDENATAGCGVNCNKHCSDIGKEPGGCIQVCYPNACDCKDGYYLDDNTGKCVLPNQCTKSNHNSQETSSSSNSTSTSSSSASSNNNNGKSTSSTSSLSQSSSSSISKSSTSGKSSSTSSSSSNAASSSSSSGSSSSSSVSSSSSSSSSNTNNSNSVSCGGDENAKPGCGVNCNRHCKDIGKKPGACILVCYENGCDCKPGYYLDDNTGKCVLPSQCTLPCGVNEVCSNCTNAGCEPKTCAETGIPLPCDQPDECLKGCICKSNYLRADNGTCIPRDQCPACGGDPNAQPGCGVNCGRLCSNYNDGPVPCPLICNINGCDCREGYVFDENLKKCVLPEDCSKPICTGPNEVYDDHPIICPPQTCDSIGKSYSCPSRLTSSKGACVCRKGYLRNEDGKCIPKEDCHKCLGQNEVYDPCPPICPPQTCDAIGKSYSCPSIPTNPTEVPGYCKPACRCKPGYYRNLIDQCISKKDCLKCTGPHEYFSCGGACDNVCATIKKQNQTHCPIINITCNRKCYCEADYARNVNGTCIPIDECEYDCTSTSIEGSTGGDDEEDDDEEVQNRLIQGNTDFTGNFLYEVIKKNPLTSVVMSPFSVLIPLAQLALYTEPGNSYDQLLNTLNLKSKDEIRRVFPALISSLKSQEEAILDLAAKIYVNKQYQLTDNFENDSRDVFGAEAENIDFSKPEQAADTINAWIEKETRELIKNVVSADMFSAYTRLVLTNVIYFLGNWQKQFNPNDTKTEDFHISNTDTVQVPLMYQKGVFRYAESKDLNCKILEITYKGGNFSYIAFLPNDVDGYNIVAEKIRDPDVFNTALDLLKYETCYLYIPRHEITTGIDLVDILQKVNVTDIFDTKKADLSGILTNNEELGVSAAIQRANIKFDETGTEAAAVNVIIVGTTSASPPETVYTFRADHPFIFYLLLERNPLFCGVYAGN
ncbi:zonadhesin isoform X1 [Galleria mellonella]|uniref:Zonadhesin isoform X1 n=1 Tax=Galleria mellonella TaxID=7137 RepID=A0ABM3MHM5_GALME|nr:zonadhesin isoform X1 [Galleria mellonella]